MKIVMLSKALVQGAYQKKLEELARLPGVQLLALVPPYWREPRVGVLPLERRFTHGYRLEVLPMRFNGHHHFHYYVGLGRVLARERPAILHIDEEAFNPATFLAMRAGVAVGARCCFYNYANISRFYPPPFNLFERYVFHHAAHGLVANAEAEAIVRRHGYLGPLTILPQFGVDPDLFAPAATPHNEGGCTIGYVGRLVPEKGVLDLIDALVGLPATTRLHLVGDGILRPQIEERARTLGLRAQLTLTPQVASSAIPAILRDLDLLVLPSRTWPNWKEQFGRILIEAMSCGIPVIGSSSGEIPNVIGDAGVVFPEGDSAALRAALLRLITDPTQRRNLAQRGRAHVLRNYTQVALAQRYYELYGTMVA